MNKRNLNYFKKRLNKELEDLSIGANCNFDSLNDSEENLPDLIDRASSFIDRSLAQNICDRENLRIQKIEQALEDMANGAYGICERCGVDITIKRLQANPLARHCLRCKTEIETRERLTGVH
jgi:DnaK suppressor protein